MLATVDRDGPVTQHAIAVVVHHAQRRGDGLYDGAGLAMVTIFWH